MLHILAAFVVVSVFQIWAIQIGVQWEFSYFLLREARKTLDMFFSDSLGLGFLGWLFTNILGLICACKVYMCRPEVASSISVLFVIF